MRKSWILICFINFFIAVAMGLLLRWMYIAPIAGVNFQFLMHGHSHIAMLGWVYMMLYCFIIYLFIPKEAQQKTIYNRLFWTTELAVIGMMIDFPAQGYAFASILFSTLHIFCSYYFCYLISKESKTAAYPEKKMLQTALFFMVFSTLGVWCLGPAVGLMGKTSAFYQIAIQFFLHFQFNGWFLFAVLSLFFKLSNLKIKQKTFRLFYNLLVSSTLLSMALPLSWFISQPYFYWINCIGAVLQLASGFVLFKIIRSPIKVFFASLSTVEKTIYQFALFSLVLKIGLQLLVLIPELAQVSHSIRNFVIGYIHLMMLGIISSFLFGFGFQNKFLNSENVTQKWGTILFLLGILATEILLFLQGLWQFLCKGSFQNYYSLLFLFSIALSIGILLLTFGVWKLKTKLNSNHSLIIDFEESDEKINLEVILSVEDNYRSHTQF